METPRCIKMSYAKIGLFLIAATITSCNTLKRVDEGELLLVKNTILADGEKVSDSDIESLIVQEPNSTLLGYPLRLNLYNLAKENPDSLYLAWLYRKEKREERLIKLLSRKQVARLGESFFVKGYSEWLKNIGEAPEVIDSAKTSKTMQRLNAYYGSKGYFNNEPSYEIVPSKRKQRAAIEYHVALGKPYKIDTLTSIIASSSIDSIYKANKDASLIIKGKKFDLSDFNLERERLTKLFRNSGIYNFQESSITYDILRDTTVAHEDTDMSVALNIENLRQRGDSLDPTRDYKVHRFGKVNIFADYSFGDNIGMMDTTNYEGYTIYYKDKLRYKPKSLTDAVFLVQDSIYRDIDRLRTYRQITNLNTFKYPNIEFIEDSTRTRLTSNIYLAPRPKYSLGLDLDITHSNIQRLGIGLSTSVITRNVFGGAETLSLSARGTFGLLSDESLPEDYFSEIGADINLIFPRIWFPVNTKKIIPYYMLPQTRATTGTSFQKNIGLDKQTFNSILGYNWSPTDFVRNTFELLNIQFVRNINPDRYFNVYTSSFSSLDMVADDFQDDPQLAQYYEVTDDPQNPSLIIPEGTTGFTNAILDQTVASTPEQYKEVSNIEDRRVRLTENNLIFASNFTIAKNNRTDIRDNKFYQIRLKLESAGVLLSAASGIIPFNKNEAGDKLVFGVPYSQYVKTEVDYIKYWDLQHSNVLAFHSFFGIAVPYGNANSIPFVRSYFAGGSNDNRGWNPYSLGPGRTKAINDFNEANLKLAFNLEYRFPIAGDVKGALFADAGNIWNIWDNVDDPDATFNGLKSLQDIALGTGFGLRYDFSYFVFRVDFGFKTYNPAEELSKRWFRDYNFANGEIQIGINYPF
jgi:outer membrane protein assembly factor BamA